MLPLIALNPPDKSCIYSTLLYIIQLAKYLNIEIPPFNLCKLKHLDSQNKDFFHYSLTFIGGFYSLMSFVGSILNVLMKALWNVLDLKRFYGKNTIAHMFSWKTISKALRRYFLVKTAPQMTSIYCQKQHLVLMKRLLKRLQIKIFQMRNF